MKAIFNLLFNLITRSAIVFTVVMFSINHVPEHIFSNFPFEPQAGETIDYNSVVPHWNSLLSDGKPEFIQLNNIVGPESIAISKSGLIYTGLADGRLIEVDPNDERRKMRTVLRIKESNVKCEDNIATRPECGRLLQLRFINDTLYGMEVTSGLYMFNINTGSKVLLGPKPIEKVNIFNSFAFDPKRPNIVYLTISSTKWNLVNFMWSIFERESSGKVMAFDIKTGKRAIVAENLSMTNGIDVDVERDRLIFSETMKGRVSTIQLKDVRAAFDAAQDKARLSDVEIKALIPIVPGFPDNIIVENDIAYIALPFVRKNGNELIDYMSSMPKVRKAIGRATFLVGVIMEYISNNFYPHPVLEKLSREFKCGHIHYDVFKTDRSAVLEYNLKTGATRFFGSDTFGFVSEAVTDHKGNIYLGSFRSPFIVKQKLPSN